jgi:hypothetical protein
LPQASRQEVLMVLSQVIARNLLAPLRKEANHDLF